MPRTTMRIADWYQFRRCSASAPWTLPACTSILTGRGSEVHRHFSHAHALGHPTLIEHFDPERHTAAIVNSPTLAKSCGLFDGFDQYEIFRRHDDVFDAAHRFLDQRAEAGAPYFLVLHSNLAHDYFRATTRAGYERAFPDRDDWFELGTRVQSGKGLGAAERETVRNTYRACCAALDQQLDRFLARLNTAETAIALVADHGEGFDFERARLHHGGRLHDDVLKVPLAISVPASAGPRVHEALRRARATAVMSTDLLPTLLSLSGHPVPDQLEGRCLDRARPPDHQTVRVAEDRRYLYLASGQRLNAKAQGKNMSRAARWKNRIRRATVAVDFNVRAVFDDRYKLIITEFDGRSALLQRALSTVLRRSHNGEPRVVVTGSRWLGFELFDGIVDPDERVNLLRAGSIDKKLLLELASRGPLRSGNVELADLVPELEA